MPLRSQVAGVAPEDLVSHKVLQHQQHVAGADLRGGLVNVPHRVGLGSREHQVVVDVVGVHNRLVIPNVRQAALVEVPVWGTEDAVSARRSGAS